MRAAARTEWALSPDKIPTGELRPIEQRFPDPRAARLGDHDLDHVFADLVRDADVVQEARRDAQTLTSNDPELTDPAWAKLRRMLLQRYGKVMELADVG